MRPEFAACVSAIVVGLVPSACALYKPVSYFAPLPSAGTTVLQTFRGLDEIASIPLQGEAKMYAIIFEQQSAARIRLNIYLPDGESLQFGGAQIRAIPSKAGGEVTAQISEIRGNIITNGVGRFSYFSPQDTLQGSTYRYKELLGGEASVYRHYDFEVGFDAPLPDQFEIYLPPMRTTNAIVNPAPISYRRRTGEAYQGSPP